MGTTERLVDASPEAVWAVLADGWSFSAWVVGCSHVRAVGPAWPAAGAQAFHSFGVWPLVLRDRTTVEESTAPARLVLTAQARPAGSGRVVVDLTPESGGRTRVSMTEHALTGPGWLTRNLLVDLLIRWRNREALARLAALAERRPTPHD